MATHSFNSDPDPELDVDFAFNLQLEEAIAASLTIQQPTPSRFNLVGKKPKTTTTEEEEEDLDGRITYQNRRRHFEYNHHYRKKSFSQGSSSSSASSSSSSKNIKDEGLFHMYFKGLFTEEKHGGRVIAGFGIAIYDSGGNLVYELKNSIIMEGINRIIVEMSALVEGLEAAIALNLQRITFYCQYYPVFQHVTGRWTSQTFKIKTLLNEISLLERNFLSCVPVCVPDRNEKRVYELAKEAIDSHYINNNENVDGKEGEQNRGVKETCVICLEDVEVNRMFCVEGCSHQYCFSCMRKHVELKLHNGLLPECPHDGCKSELTIACCKKFLTTKVIEIFHQRKKEASIPDSEKVYCPYPRCSTLMSKGEVFKYSRDAMNCAHRIGARKCLKCKCLFCINCRIPWHHNLTCSNYKTLNPDPLIEDLKLKSLARMKQWRQCGKCKHMIELSEGCYHITCRCGFEFCYNCGAERDNHEATCSCPAWNDENIMDSDDEDFDIFDIDYNVPDDYEYDPYVDSDYDCWGD